MVTVTDSSVNHGYEYGAQLKEPSEVSRYFRMVYNDESAEAWGYADDVILDIISRNPQQPGQDDEDYNNFILEQMEEFSPKVLPDLSVQDKVNASVVDLEIRIDETARILNQNTELLSILGTIDIADKTVYMGPITLYRQLVKMMSEGFDFWSRIAEPGTSKDHIDIGSNRPWDTYSKYIPTSSGGRREKKFSQLDEIAFKLAPIARAAEQSETFKKKINEKQSVAPNTADKRAQDKTKTVLKRSFRQACGIVHMLNRMDTLTKLRCKVHTDPNTKGDRVTPTPIHIWDKDDPTVTGQYTIVQFLSFRPQKLQADATLEQLIGSIEGRDSTPKTRYPLPENREQGEDMLNQFVTYMVNGDTFKTWAIYLQTAEAGEAIKALNLLDQRIESLLSIKRQSDTHTDNRRRQGK